MPIDNLDETLKQLEKKVSNYVTGKTSSFTSGVLPKVNTKVLLVYGSIPVSVTILLAIWKPAFVCKEEDDDETLKRSLSLKKLMIAVVIVSVVVCGLLFMYLRKKEIRL